MKEYEYFSNNEETPPQMAYPLMLNNFLYYIDPSQLYKLELIDPNGDPRNGKYNISKYNLSYPAIVKMELFCLHNIVGLNNTIYYMSASDAKDTYKLCSAEISGNTINSNIIDNVTSSSEINFLTTDANSRIWIIDPAGSVIEYNTSDKTATTIANSPSQNTMALFYSNAYLYCIVDSKVYSLAVGGDIPEKEKKWVECTCDNINSVNTENLNNYTNGDNQYLFSGVDNLEVYNFTANETQVTLSNITKGIDQVAPGMRLLVQNQNNIVVYAMIPNGEYDISLVYIYDWINETEKQYSYIGGYEENPALGYGQDNILYLLSDKGILYQLELDDEYGAILPVLPTPYNLQYAPIENTSLIVLKDTMYYFSKSGFCSVQISGNTATSNLISSVTVTDETSNLVTNNNDKIWIINRTDGVIEYNIADNKSKKIASYIEYTTRSHDRACFYSKDYLYCVTDSKVYALSLTETPGPKPEPDPKKKSKVSWIGPIIPVISNGYEFSGLATFYTVADHSYLSIVCNGFPTTFLFDPQTCAFQQTSKALNFNPANNNNPFMNDQFVYIYNAESNTITCTDTKTGMSKEITCYETMPNDVIQIAFANNAFFILTQSGENHIARIDGSQLKFESSWKLDNWTPRLGASIVSLNNKLFVYGGKSISNEEDSSSSCYNELYIYDFSTNSSERLDAPVDMTARYGAKILVNKRYKKLWFICGKDASDSTAGDIWEFNVSNKKWTYIINLPTEDGNSSACYDEEKDTLSLLVTPESDDNNLFSINGLTRASSGAVVYKIQGLSKATNTAPEQSGKSCGCLDIEFLFIIASLFILRRNYSMRNA